MDGTILIIEQDRTLARLLELELKHQGYAVRIAHDGLTGLIALREFQPDLLILNWSIPGLASTEICHYLRSTGQTFPIVLLSNSHEIRDRVTGLDAGADDYILLPFSLEEFLARVRSHLRRLQRDRDPGLLRFGEISLNPRTREVHQGQRVIPLTAKEFDLLHYLMAHPRQVITRQQIFDHVWDYEFLGNSNVIEVYIRHLRRKLEANQGSRLIHTIRGIGYVLREDYMEQLAA